MIFTLTALTDWHCVGYGDPSSAPLWVEFSEDVIPLRAGDVLTVFSTRYPPNRHRWVAKEPCTFAVTRDGGLCVQGLRNRNPVYLVD